MCIFIFCIFIFCLSSHHYFIQFSLRISNNALSLFFFIHEFMYVHIYHYYIIVFFLVSNSSYSNLYFSYCIVSHCVPCPIVVVYFYFILFYFQIKGVTDFIAKSTHYLNTTQFGLASISPTSCDPDVSTYTFCT